MALAAGRRLRGSLSLPESLGSLIVVSQIGVDGEAIVGKGLGIAALVFALIAIVVPFGFVLSAIAMVLATVAALASDRTFTIASLAIAAVNTLFLSPSTWIMLEGGDAGARSAMITGIIIFGGLPILAMVLNASGRLVIKT